MPVVVSIGLKPDWFKPTQDEDGDFELLVRPLNAYELTEVQHCFLSGDVAKAASQVVEFAVSDWRGTVVDPAGAPVAFSKSAVAALPATWIQQLVAHVMRASQLSAAQKKTSP